MKYVILFGIIWMVLVALVCAIFRCLEREDADEELRRGVERDRAAGLRRRDGGMLGDVQGRTELYTSRPRRDRIPPVGGERERRGILEFVR